MIIIKLKTKKKMPCYISFHLQNSYDSYVNIFFLMYAHNVNGISFYELSFHIIIILLIIIITIIMITIITIIIIMIIIIMIKNVGTPCSINGIIFLLECQELI